MWLQAHVESVSPASPVSPLEPSAALRRGGADAIGDEEGMLPEGGQDADGGEAVVDGDGGCAEAMAAHSTGGGGDNVSESDVGGVSYKQGVALEAPAASDVGASLALAWGADSDGSSGGEEEEEGAEEERLPLELLQNGTSHQK